MKNLLTILLLATLGACTGKATQKPPLYVPKAAGQSNEKKQLIGEDHLYNLPLKGMVFWIRQQLHR